MTQTADPDRVRPQWQQYAKNMREKIAEATFSLNGLSLAVGALGFLSGVVQLFVDTNLQISIKWVLFVVWISLTLGMVFLKIVYDLHNEKRPAPHSRSQLNTFPTNKYLSFDEMTISSTTLLLGVISSKTKWTRLLVSA